MHNSPPETSGSQHPANAAPRPHSRLWGGVSMMGLLCLLGTFLISGSLFWLAAPETEQQALIAPSTTVPLTHKKIQDIQPGQWVKAENPAEEDDLEFGRHVDPATWKLLTCIAPKLDGTKARVQLLRPDLWLSLHHASVGETIYISVPECGIDGNAQVLEITNCPPIAANPGPGFQIVTGTFQHEAAQTLDISVEDELKPIGTTPNHPIWSVDREAFVRADNLTVGERLQTLNGIARITNITARGPPEPVYNLEVQVKHTYFVADSGVLVHNGGLCPPNGAAGDVMIDTGIMRNFVAEGSNMRHVQKAVVGNRGMIATQAAVDEFRAAMLRNGSIQEKLRANRLIKRLTVVPDNTSSFFSALTPSRKMGANDIGIFGTADRLGIETLTTDKAFLKTFFNKIGQSINGQWFAPYVSPGP